MEIQLQKERVMQNQVKYLFFYFVINLCVFCLLVTSDVSLAQAQQEASENTPEVAELDQAQIDQMLAPIALYPDTLLSHILVASTYPLEVIQAARWRAANEDLNEKQALNAIEDKNWDPSVQALAPFNDLLHRLSEDLDWLQSLGSAFLVHEQQILSSVQNLRLKAYEQGNLTDNDYVDVEQEEGSIIIETVRKEVVYVPYYDTRIVYGNWWWQNHQPYYWHRPNQSTFNAGLYWSVGFNIRPNFYFGGFHWRNRHVVANYHYRSHVNRYWSNGHNNRQVVRVTEYPHWSHNQRHRRGAQHRINGQRIVRNIDGSETEGYPKTNKKRMLNVNDYTNSHAINYTKKHNKNNAIRANGALDEQQQTAIQTKTPKINKLVNNKQRLSSQSKSQQKKRLANNYRPKNTAKFNSEPYNARQSQKYASLETKANKETRYPVNTQNSTNSRQPRNKSNSNNYPASSDKQNKSRPVNVSRQSNQNKTQRR
jgi:hypothetical protein